MADARPIGVFDSGVGGLTVVSQIQKLLPGEDIVYFGDTARVPYGTKSKETVTKFSVENVEFLMKNDVKIIVVACNTASSLSLDFLKRCFRVPMIGVIEPGAKASSAATRNKRVGVIGTCATISSLAYERAIKKADPRISVYSQSCSLLVPLVEEGWLNKAITRQVASEYLAPVRSKRIDTLILGCTHYPLLKPVIQDVVGSGVVLIDSSKEVAKEVRLVLDSNCILNNPRRKGRSSFYVSDEPARFVKMAERFLKRRISCVKRDA